jgi:4-hydroxy-tetrahydrodipicolinate reductase
MSEPFMTTKKLSVWIHGLSGRVGQELQRLLESEAQQPFVLVGGSHKSSGWSEFARRCSAIEMLIDFSSAEGNVQLLKQLQENRGDIKSVLIGTTGLSAEHVQAWQKFAKAKGIAVLLAPNTSLGIRLVLQSALQMLGPCVQAHFDIEISETHHRHKKDAPSGTALMLAHKLADQLPDGRVVTNRSGLRKSNEIGVQSLRGGEVFGEHHICFLGDEEQITISHRAFSRTVWARGGLLLAGWLAAQKPGWYVLDDVT